MYRSIRTRLAAVIMVVAAVSSAHAQEPAKARGPAPSLTVSGWVTELIAEDRIGTSIPAAHLLRRNVADLDSVKIRINGRTLRARIMSEALYEELGDNVLLLEGLGADVICLIRPPGPLSHVELIVLDPAQRPALKARHQMPVRMELAQN